MSSAGSLRRLGAEHPFAADTVLALAVLAVSVTVAADAPGTLPAPDALGGVVLTAACAALVLRRRRPVAVWVLVLVCALVSITLDGARSPVLPAAMVAVYSLVVRLRPRRGLVVVLVSVAALVAAAGAAVGWRSPLLYTATAWTGLAGALGAAVGGHRAVLAAAENRAREAEGSREQEAQRRVVEERLRIAQDLHDVVAHHIAVIGVQAGVVQHLLRSDPARAEVAAGHVRAASEEVIAEMGAVLRVLRARDEGSATDPAPGLAQVDTLVESARRAGLRVVLSSTGRPFALAPVVDLTAYRVVQESLTNAAKHGDGEVHLTIGHREHSVVVEAANHVAPGEVASGTGYGLVGMRERVDAVGGTVEAGVRPGGKVFHVRAELPATPSDGDRGRA
ncbi:sensor histidine kinase [Kineococcus glutinatus]|uniref:histidine kinase n=1 Tax=Kineococcus glutinatus TaxID=1070872 RepID=A0ABP9HGF8_9ACTN